MQFELHDEKLLEKNCSFRMMQKIIEQTGIKYATE